MGYPDCGGLTAEERTRRERVRLAIRDADVGEPVAADASRNEPPLLLPWLLPRQLSAWEVGVAHRA